MSDADRAQIKTQRDSFIAFSLAAADLLVETDAERKVVKLFGAVKALLGVDSSAVLGRPLDDFLPAADAALVRHLFRTAARAGRIDPTPVTLAPPGHMPVKAMIGMTWLDGPKHLFASLSVLPAELAAALADRDPDTGLLSLDAFNQTVTSGLKTGPADLQLFHLQGLPGQLNRLPKPRADAVLAEVGGALRSMASEGGLAAQLDRDKFGIIAKPSEGGSLLDLLRTQVQSAFREQGIEAAPIAATAEKVSLDLEGLDAPGAAKALAYALKTFAASGADAAANLRQNLEKAVQSTSTQLERARRTIDDGNFELHYQPVVDLATREVHHFEALLRLADGSNPFETVTFSEDVGLSCDLDFAVLERAIAAIRRNPAHAIAINLSGLSLQSESFCTRMLALLDAQREAAAKLMFELTESAAVTEFEGVATIIERLRRRRHAVCLDDFGAGSAAYNYLRRFDVDYVKIDGAFVAGAERDMRERSLLKSLVVLCAELKTEVIAEMIEREPTAAFVRSVGIGYAQGYLFGRPEAQLPKPVINARRMGSRDTWS